MKKKKSDLEVEKTKFEQDVTKSDVEIDSKHCQTDGHPDLPIEITSPLPPIFSSELCHATPPARFISHSMPRLDLICWASPEDWCVDDVDDFLNYQHDEQIKLFYLDAKQQAKDQRLEQQKEH